MESLLRFLLHPIKSQEEQTAGNSSGFLNVGGEAAEGLRRQLSLLSHIQWVSYARLRTSFLGLCWRSSSEVPGKLLSLHKKNPQLQES